MVNSVLSSCSVSLGNMTSAVVVFTVVLFLHRSTSTPTYSGEMPWGWEKVCVRTNSRVDWNPEPPSYNWSQPIIHISCRLTQSSLSLSDFRDWSNGTAGQPVALDILCMNQMNSSINFPWPFMAPNLVSLKVVNCRIKGFYSEYLSDSSNVPSRLRILMMDSVVNYLTLSHLNDRSSNVLNISRHMYCSSEYLEKFVWRNFRTVPVIDNTDFLKNTTEILKAWIRNRQLIPYKCDYKYLQSMDESNTDRFNQPPMHFYQQRLSSAFPRLLFYNLSRREYSRLPNALIHWRLAYPRLRHLDLTWNNISSFNFIDFGETGDDVGEIDLRYNNISHLTKESIESLVRLKTAVVNLRNNPLSCDCFNNQHLFRLLRDNPRLSAVGLANYEYIRNITCASPEGLVGVPFGQLAEQDIFCEESKPGTYIWIATLLSFFVLLFVVVLIVVLHEKVAILLRPNCATFLRKLRGRSNI